jgi:hypothetical protein
MISLRRVTAITLSILEVVRPESGLACPLQLLGSDCGRRSAAPFYLLPLLLTEDPAMSVAVLGSSMLLAAAGYSLIYLLLGGGLGGAILIFIVAKMLGR